MKNLKMLSIAALTILIGFTACKKEDQSPNPNNTAKAGTFETRMTDSPGDFEELNVEIVKVEAFLENEGWIEMNNEAQMVAVHDLTNGTETTLALKSDAKAGNYTKVKITFGEKNTLTTRADAFVVAGSLEGSATFNLRFEGPKEYIIEIDEEVSSESGASVLLDFQVVQSIIKDTEEFVLKPVITEIEDEKTGLEGKLEGSAKAAIMLYNEKDTLSTMIDANGEFLFRGMEEGVYDLLIMPETNDGPEPGQQNQEIEGVVISKGEIYNAGTIRL